MPSTPAMTTGIIHLITRPGFITYILSRFNLRYFLYFIINKSKLTPIDEIPTPDFAVPYAAPILAKHKAAVTPMKPKKGAEVGHVSYDTVILN